MTFSFLPTTKAEMQLKGWDSVDVIIVTGDAYIDHPSFGAALIGRFLESHGLKVGIIAQPNWNNLEDFKALGQPNLFFGITAGNLDSMIANYTSEKRKRKTDAYSENNQPGLRPDRATVVYSNCVRQCYKDTPIILGGLEASLRRLTHYDYWSNKLRRSILFDSRADLLVYGMGESALVEIATQIKHQQPLIEIPNTAYISKDIPLRDHLLLTDHETLQKSKKQFAITAVTYAKEIAKKYPRLTVQSCNNRYLIIAPPKPITPNQLDTLYHLPFSRQPHPKYKNEIPAFGFIKDSVVSHRGCYGGCSFCSLNAHQGKHIISRSKDSILDEIKTKIIPQKSFKGSILDIGGPSANMYKSQCKNKKECNKISCLYPQICTHLSHQQHQHMALLKDALKLPAVKNVFVNSGIRFDLAIQDKKYIDQLCQTHVCGQLSAAPEHISSPVLNIMQKPNFSIYEQFVSEFKAANQKANKKQFIIPYFIAAHPGCTLKDMQKITTYLKKNKLKLQQVQSYIPIPLTLSAAMYYTELNVFTLQKIHVAKNEERIMQRALLQPHIKSNQKWLKKINSKN